MADDPIVSGHVLVAFEEARVQFASLMERKTLNHSLVVHAFQQLEGCLAAAERLEQQRWRHLCRSAAARWRHLSEEACRPRQEQLTRRRQLLGEQQQQLDALLREAHCRLKQLAAPPNDLPRRLQRKWERMRGEATGAGSLQTDDAELELEPEPEPEPEPQPEPEPGPPPSRIALKPWNIEGLSLDDVCDKRRLLERERQVDAQLHWLHELRDNRYRPVADYTHCLRRLLVCTGNISSCTSRLMKVRADVRLHAGWARDHRLRLRLAIEPASDASAAAELRYYELALQTGALQPDTTCVGDASAGGAGVALEPPLEEKLLYGRLDAADSRRLVADAAERGSWYEVEFALAHDRLTLGADCVIAMFMCCHCRGRCSCQWTRLAKAAQRRVPDRPTRAHGWGWRKMRMACQLIRLLRRSQTDE